MARSGLDFIIIDLEHGPIDYETAHAMIAATIGSLLVPLVLSRRGVFVLLRR
jgi:4-hydroxy-2-oxoheptanedioate aldolase